jgi:hypothetical protein
MLWLHDGWAWLSTCSFLLILTLLIVCNGSYLIYKSFSTQQ